MAAGILVVDDSRIDRLLIEETLRRSGHHVASAGDAPEALARLDMHPVDLVVADLHLPGMNGLELLQRIGLRLAPPPVILVTHHSSETTAIEAFRAGVEDYIPKAHLAAQLPSAVDRVLSQLEEDRRRREADRWTIAQRTTYLLPSDRSQVCPLVRRLLEIGLEFGALTEQDEVRVAVALEEALLNAVIHGNLEVSSKLREEEGTAYDDLIAERQHDPQYGRRMVRVDCEVSAHEVRFRITDEGPGFDVAGLPDPRDDDRIALASGRGILMMRAFMDDVVYNRKGNEVTLVKRGSPTAPSRREEHSCCGDFSVAAG